MNVFFRNISTFAVWPTSQMVGAKQSQPTSRFRDESKAWPVAADKIYTGGVSAGASAMEVQALVAGSKA